MVPQQGQQRVEHVNRATTTACDCVYTSTDCSFQCTYVDTPIKPWKCNWLRNLTFYCLATKRNKKERRKWTHRCLLIWPEGDKRTTWHTEQQNLQTPHTHPHKELKTLFLLSLKRNPEPSCLTIKSSWQIYSVGITDVFMNTDGTAYFIWTVKSTPANEYFSACLTLSNGTLHLGCV